MSDDPASKDGMRWEIRRSLIERLRIPWDGMGEMANQQRAEAAVQISTMMDEIERLREERDEARLEACRWMAEAEGGTPEEHAQEQGWDCFQEKP